MKTHLRGIAMIVIVALVAMASGKLEASLAPASLPGQNAVRSQDLQTVQTFLEQKVVSQHLATLKLNQSDINSRLSSLSDQDLHKVALRIQQEKPGGDGVAGVLVLVILVLLIIYLLKRV